ncbi:inter-alpha-trypsin inhibitor heavy chain H3-like isoform X3 [Hyperolius riggenbachi]|uniref:inter-alpha-trypsin inhibitor heavy chain H3-like isoform X3 n=1 Tax=Hyperolius riggenbachi TaxID=752182 RepID=UPI0035A39C4E
MRDAAWSSWRVTFWLTVAFMSHTSYGREKMDIQSMHIDTKVTSRFARTLITMVVQNPSNSSQEGIFDVELPKTAFITNFSMTIDNVTNVGTVKERAEAKRQYQKAVSKGQSAGLVQLIDRKMEHFKISVNVGSLAKATFKLTYEELLKRQLGSYELNIRVRPQELVENFQITVDIIESQGISFLKAAGTFTSNEVMDIVKVNRTETKAHIEFSPTVDQQRRCPGCLETVLDGDLKIKYDVKRENSAGKLQVVNGYFVHYFAPPSLSRITKNVVFVLDHSGSMYGTKIKQTYEAFIKILGDVPIEDHFGLLMFDDKVDKWKRTLVKATPDNINKAKEFVSHMTARGGTDINIALLTAAKMLTNATINNMLPKVSASIIIFLSDGEPTSGTTDHKKIISNVKHLLEGQASLYCLGFGKDVDYNFLERLALENGGLARRIYEDSDSALQLQGFYNEVAYPMLLDVNLKYIENSVDYVTQNSFKHYYQGSEIIVAGHVTDNNLDVLTAEVSAKGMSEPFSIKVETNLKEEDVEKEQQYIFGDFTERLWAYLTIEQLLIQQISLDGEDKQRVKEKALNLSLKYHFVTPLTSMVVTTDEEKEDADKQLVANKPKEGEQAMGEDFPLDYDADKMLDNHYYVDYAAEVTEPNLHILDETTSIISHHPVLYTEIPHPETTTATAPRSSQPVTTDVLVATGGKMTLTCKVDEHDDSSLQWSNPAQKTLYFGDKRVLKDNRIELVKSTPFELSISISNVVLSDEGEYTCSIFTMPVKTAKAMVTVLEIPHPETTTPTAPRSSRPVTTDVLVAIGGKMTLTCKVDEHYNSSLQWSNPAQKTLYFGEKRVLKDNRIQLVKSTPSELSISISNVMLSDEGEYTCFMFTMPVRTAKAMVTVLEVPQEPKITGYERPFNENENAALRCTTSGSKQGAYIKWYKGAVALEGAQNSETKDPNGKTFTVVSVINFLVTKDDDQAEITCTVGHESMPNIFKSSSQKLQVLFCRPFHFLLRMPQLSQRICLRFSQDNNSYVNLFHDEASEITLNAKLRPDISIERFGFLNSKLGVRAEIAEDKVTITHGRNTEVYSWDSSFRRDGFLKEGEKITAELQAGFHFTILRVEQKLHLSLYVEDLHVPSNNSGIIGHLLNDGKISFNANVLTAENRKFLMLSFTGCDLSPYEAKDLNSCQFLIFDINNFIGGGRNFVSDIFTVPQHDTT